MGNYVNWIQQCIPYDVLVSLNVFFCLYYCGPFKKSLKLYTKKILFFYSLRSKPLRKADC